MSIRSRDICDQSGKLSGISPNFGRFLPSLIVLEAVLTKFVPTLSLFLEARRLVKFCEVTPHTLKL